MEKHPDRTILLKHLEKADPKIETHLETCENCRGLIELFRRFPISGQSELIAPPDFMVKKAISLISESPVREFIKNLIPKLVFDSWDMVQLATTRDISPPSERRIHFQEEGLLFELSAIKLKGKWQFTAMLSGDNVADPESYSVAIGNRTISVNEMNFFHWDSVRPPKVIKLKSKGESITLPEIKWSFKKK